MEIEVKKKPLLTVFNGVTEGELTKEQFEKLEEDFKTLISLLESFNYNIGQLSMRKINEFVEILKRSISQLGKIKL